MTRLRNVPIGLAVSICLACAAFTDDAGKASSTDSVPPAAMDLKLEQPSVYGDFEIIWIDCQDSRCPEDVDCVWEGEVVASLTIAKRTRESAPTGPAEVELRLRAGTPTQTAEAYGYVFELENVSPYPRAGVQVERSDLVARVRAKSLTADSD